MQDAYKHLDMMQSEGVQPNQVTFTILIDGHFRSGEIDLAVSLFNRMNAQSCSPDKIVYNTLIRGLCKHERLIDALSISYTMLKKGFAPSKASYEKLLTSLCANNWSVHALKIYYLESEKLLRYQPHKTQTLTDALAYHICFHDELIITADGTFGMRKAEKIRDISHLPISEGPPEVYVPIVFSALCQVSVLLVPKEVLWYEHKSVLRFLETFENYRVERCLHLCREYGIVDTASLLLERVGDIGSALLLAISSLAEKFILLLKVNTVMQLPRISKLFFKQERGFSFF
uniref:Pentatricopeptide repeat-containing protein At1g79540-like n=1 Tax=Nicotiana sylvestris TaxID=4096 RepID=A0A1U7VHJ2_NICSY|nr:PREDICTED: pentatricopeptide repeat-containing protein At1g79540-like [Nicotiana sylvestris]